MGLVLLGAVVFIWIAWRNSGSSEYNFSDEEKELLTDLIYTSLTSKLTIDDWKEYFKNLKASEEQVTEIMDAVKDKLING